MRGLEEVKEIRAADTALEQDLKWAVQIRKLRKGLERWENPYVIAKILKILKKTGTPLFWFSIESPNCLEEEDNENTLREVVKMLKHHVKFVKGGGKVPTVQGVPFKYAHTVTSDDETKIMFTDISNLGDYVIFDD